MAEIAYTPFQGRQPLRLIVRRVRPSPGSQYEPLFDYAYHGFITDRQGDHLSLEADHRRHAEVENAIRDRKYGVGLNHLPAGKFAANGAVAGGTGNRPQSRPLAHCNRCWRRPSRYHPHPAAPDIRPAGTPDQIGAPPHPASAVALALGQTRGSVAYPAAGAAAARLTARPRAASYQSLQSSSVKRVLYRSQWGFAANYGAVARENGSQGRGNDASGVGNCLNNDLQALQTSIPENFGGFELRPLLKASAGRTRTVQPLVVDELALKTAVTRPRRRPAST